MAHEISFTKEQLEKLISSTSELFDVVRLVDPINMVVYNLHDGKFTAQADGCYHVWNKTGRCENCVSSRCFIDEARYSKFEFIDQDIYHVVAQPVLVEGRKFVLEVVTASNDNVLLSAFGNNDFVDRITNYNHKVYTDALTQLSNRRYLDERLPVLVNRAAHDGASLSVAMVDIDDFKRVNDVYGPLKGDEVLQTAAAHLKKGIAPGADDIVARYGGDEFFVALKGITREELERRLQKVLELVASSELAITVSVGAHFKPVAERVEAEKLIRRADRAMYGIKTAGKNNYAIIDD